MTPATKRTGTTEVQQFAELEIRLSRTEREAYRVELRFNDPSSDAEVPSEKGRAAIVPQELLQLQHDPEAYGTTLAARLFHDDNIRNLYSKVRAVVESKRLALRLRLVVEPDAAELQSLRWELLADPEMNTPLGTSERVLFSRFMQSKDWREVRLRPKEHIRALIAVAAPSNLAEYKLAEIDINDEIARAKDSLAGIDFEVVGKDEPLTHERLINSLRNNVDILYLVCHGVLKNGKEPYLFLQDNEGRVARISGVDFAQHISELDQPPSLVVLASCESAGTEEGVIPTLDKPAAQSSLAPRLAEAGVPAVLAMQGRISMDTVERAMPQFFSQLIEHGQIDRAMAVARGTVRERTDSWMPALFMRLKSGRIWYEPDLPEEELDFVAPELLLAQASVSMERWEETASQEALSTAEKLFGKVFRRTRDPRAGRQLASIAWRTRQWRKFASVAALLVWTSTIVRITFPLLIAGLIYGFWPPSTYYLRVNVLDQEEKPADDAEVRLVNLSGIKKKVEGGWEFEIAASNVPEDGHVQVHAEIARSFLTGDAETTLGRRDNTSTVTVQLQKDTSARIGGKVLEFIDGEFRGIDGACVSVRQHEAEAIKTDRYGNFDLQAHAARGESVQLHVEKPGFTSNNDFYRAGAEDVEIVLEKLELGENALMPAGEFCEARGESGGLL